MAGEECEALGIVAQQHCAEVAVAKADLAVVRDGTVEAEALEADADHLCGFGSVFDAGLHGDGSAYAVCPADVLKADGLDARRYLIGVKALGLAHLSALFDRADAVLSEDAVYLVYSSLVIFKQSH